jgi:site-specific recombinase XerD
VAQRKLLESTPVPAAALYASALDWLPAPERALLERMLTGYTNWRVSRRHGPKSIYSSLNVICDFLHHAKGIPGQVAPSDFERWGTHLYAERQIAASTQRKYQTDVRCFFDYVQNEPRFRNEVRQHLGTDIVQVSTPENSILHRQQVERSANNGRRAFTEEELLAYFASLDRDIEFAYRNGNNKTLFALQRDKTMFWMAARLGLRLAEAVGLNVDAFEPNPEFPEMGRYGFVRVFGKGSKWRTVTVVDVSVAQLLEWYVTSVRPQYLSRAVPGDLALFFSEQGKRLSGSGFYRQHRVRLDRAQLALSLSPHALRHTAISHNDMLGMSLEANRQQAGHQFGATTQGYTHHPDHFIREEFSRTIRKSIQRKSETDRK